MKFLFVWFELDALERLSSWAIFSNFMRRARSLARTRCCLAAMHLMWSSNVNTEFRMITGLPVRFDGVFLIVIFNDLLSSLSGLTSTSFCVIFGVFFWSIFKRFTVNNKNILELSLRILLCPNRYAWLRAQLE